MSGRGRRAVAGPALAFAIALAGCAWTNVSATQTDPWEAALARSREILDGARAVALEASEDQDVLTFAARHNPAPCECPAWEIVYRGRWTRVFLESSPEDPELLAVLASAAAGESDSDELRTWSITGRLVDDWRLDDVTGLQYPVLAVEAIAER